MALTLAIHVAAAGTCTFSASLASRPPPTTGPFQFVAAQLLGNGDDRFLAWAAGQVDPQVHVVGLADTRTEFRASDGLSVMALRFGAGHVQGDVALTVAAIALQPLLQNGTTTPGLRLEVACDAGFSVTAMAAGREVRLFDQGSLQGGLGVGVGDPVPASAAIEDALAAHFTSPQVRLLADSGPAAAVLRLRSPDGTEALPLAGLAVASATHGAGDYELTLERLGAGQVDAFVGALLGVAPLPSLDALT